MKIVALVVTRSGSCHVKTMHTILRYNIKCLQNSGVQSEIAFVNDDPYDKSESIERFIKTHDRIFFIDFGVHLDDNALSVIFAQNDNFGIVVFPSVNPGIDWGMFKDKVNNGSKEPTNQMGLSFDTDVSTCIEEDFYNVKSTYAKTWVMMCKSTLRNIKCKRSGNYKIHPKLKTMFTKFKENGVKIVAYTAARTLITHQHECVGNILNSAGIKAN
jgi:hypothetical protein